MQKHILGFPRIGKDRELKKALELHWKGGISAAELHQTAEKLKKKHWDIQKNAGLTWVSVGDFSFYDHVLDTAVMLNMIPDRFKRSDDPLDVYFKMARGDASENIPAMEMTKWFDTNYHYIVPEISETSAPSLNSRAIIESAKEAGSAGYNPKPVLVGPVTFLSLSKSAGGFDKWSLIDRITEVYAEVISELGGFCDVIQMDEPVLCGDMEERAAEVFTDVYKRLNEAAGDTKLMLAAYFDKLDDNLELAIGSGCAILHADLVRGIDQAEEIAERMPAGMSFSAGIVDGRNIWKTDMAKALSVLEPVFRKLGNRLMIGSSCSLLHSPVDITAEEILDPHLKNWMAFAVQKCSEIDILGDALSGADRGAELTENINAIEERMNSGRVTDAKVQKRIGEIGGDMLRRLSPPPLRKEAQSRLNLPLFPATTIGSFPQTPEIRKKRRELQRGSIFYEDYEAFIKNIIAENIKIQEELGLDVLVHGEPERNDMVEYFGQQMNGFCFTSNGWVQSYGSRCVKPPVIYGDVSGKYVMTADWITYAQSLTDKPVKGMLTGPVTIMCWSFVRDDLPRKDVCMQIALAVRDEVSALEKAGTPIIQIDEAAFSEGMPLKRRDREKYLNWAAEAYRLATCTVADTTQIHSHMCYSEFNSIMGAIAAMDADVISIESSRSGMELLDAFSASEYPGDIGPGVYDIHSPRVPTAEEMKGLLEKALKKIPSDRLWVNPDCGLKTRNWKETKESLKNMVKAASDLRAEYIRRKAV